VGETPRCVGRFFIDFKLIEEDPLIVLLMLSGTLVVRAEARLEMNAVEYHAYCAAFDEVVIGQQIPEYIAEFNRRKEIAEDHDDGSPGGEIKVIDVFERWVKREVVNA